MQRHVQFYFIDLLISEEYLHDKDNGYLSGGKGNSAAVENIIKESNRWGIKKACQHWIELASYLL